MQPPTAGSSSFRSGFTRSVSTAVDPSPLPLHQAVVDLSRHHATIRSSSIPLLSITPPPATGTTRTRRPSIPHVNKVIVLTNGIGAATIFTLTDRYSQVGFRICSELGRNHHWINN
uniref:Uncharacterized protein n=1 Tax=Oryza punctata TaxID=4537 RepID=A0A0E0K2C7_ORYPU